MLLTVEVTAEDINAGKKSDPEGCPIAVACKRVLGVEKICVGFATLNVYGPGAEVKSYAHNGMHFVKFFDNDRDVQPFTLTLGSRDANR